MPKLPDIGDVTISRGAAVNITLASIAMEELALAHILNAEGEKLQYFLGTLEGSDPGEVTLCDIMAANESVRDMLKEIMKTELVLQFKLEDALKLGPDGGES